MGAAVGIMACGRQRGEDALERRQRRDREMGQEQLRKIVASAHEEGGLDWAALIKKAEELHRRDQEYEKRRRRKAKKKKRSPSSRLQQNLERRRRRKADATGSFSVNLATFRNEVEIPLLVQKQGDDDSVPALTSARSHSGSESTSRIDECDHSSNDGSGSFALSEGLHTHGSSWEEGLATIHE